MAALNIFGVLQACCTVVALFLNSFLIYIIKNYTRSAIGSYKWVLITFAAFEMTYAVVVLIGMPINFISDRSWIVFNHDGLIGRTSFNWIGPGLYCVFYQLWMQLVVVHFVYRYVVVCRLDWKQKIQEKMKWKLFIVFIYLMNVFYAVICGMYFCTRSTISPELTQTIHDTFAVEEPQYIGYILLRAKTLEGEWSPGGIISILNHYIVVLTSVVIIGFAGINIWISIKKMQKESIHLREVNLQKQMFVTLLIQTTIPFFLCHLPTLVFLVGTSPFISKDFSFGSIASMFSFLTAVPKVLDPIVVLVCIREYRQAVLKILRGWFTFKNQIVAGVPDNQIHTSTGAKSSTHLKERTHQPLSEERTVVTNDVPM